MEPRPKNPAPNQYYIMTVSKMNKWLESIEQFGGGIELDSDSLNELYMQLMKVAKTSCVCEPDTIWEVFEVGYSILVEGVFESRFYKVSFKLTIGNPPVVEVKRSLKGVLTEIDDSDWLPEDQEWLNEPTALPF